MGSELAVVPRWAAPPHDQIRDLHAIAYARATRDHSRLAGGCLDALDWATDAAGPSRDEAMAEATTLTRRRREGDYWAGIADTLAWLCGFLSRPPLDVPRRNPDGTVVTWQQRYAELDQGARWEPEQAEEAERTARRQAARWQALANLAEEAF